MENRGDYYVLGGDILLDKKDDNDKEIIKVFRGDYVPPEAGTQSRAMMESRVVDTWPSGFVPYYFNGTFTQQQKTAVLRAMRTYEMLCNVRFVYTPSTPDTEYIYQIFATNEEGVAARSTLG